MSSYCLLIYCFEKVDIDWHKYVSLSDIGNRRAQRTQNFQCLTFRWKNEFDFLDLANVKQFFQNWNLFKENCKNKLLDLYFLCFHNKYDENISCTWRIVCGYTKFKEVKKTQFPLNYELRTEGPGTHEILLKSLLFLFFYKAEWHCLSLIAAQW